MVEKNHPLVESIEKDAMVSFLYEKKDGTKTVRIVIPYSVYTRNDDNVDYLDAYQISKSETLAAGDSEDLDEDTVGWRTFIIGNMTDIKIQQDGILPDNSSHKKHNYKEYAYNRYASRFLNWYIKI